MGNLEFQAAAREASGEPVVFSFGGEKFTAVAPGGLVVLEFAAMADLDTESQDAGELASAGRAIYDFMRSVIADEDWARFRRTAVANRTTLEDLLQVIRGLMPALTGRPTEPPSLSPESASESGRPSTDVPLHAVSTSPG